MLRKLGRPWGREGERQRGREQHSQATPSMFFFLKADDRPKCARSRLPAQPLSNAKARPTVILFPAGSRRQLEVPLFTASCAINGANKEGDLKSRDLFWLWKKYWTTTKRRGQRKLGQGKNVCHQCAHSQL